MTRARLLYEVVIWEFWRWFKIRDQLLTLVMSLVIGLAVWGGTALVSRGRGKPVTLVVVGLEVLPFTLAEDSRIQLAPDDGRSTSALRVAVAADELDALLIIESTDRASLVVKTEPHWLGELETGLTEARRATELQTVGLSIEQLAAVLAPITVEVSYVEGATAPTSGPERVTAIVIVVVMMVAVFLGMAFQFVAITGEKQHRVTEQVVSAISAQTWIDGKILGVSLVALATLFTYLVAIVVFLAVSRLFGRDIPIPLGMVGPEIWLALIPVAVAGFLFWNTVFGAIAATIDDPNTSARGSLLMLPMIPVVMALFRLSTPDTALTQFFAIFPLTSPAFLPLRLMLTTVPIWEILLSLALLIGAVAFMRRAAGKIFAMGILMYGKEPTWTEMLRWIRSA